MKIQLSPRRIVEGAITVWHEHSPEVDIVMDLKNLTFAPDSLDLICAIHVLDHFFPDEAATALINWRKCLKPNKQGALFVVVDDFEYIARELLGGEINIDIVNEKFTHPMQFSRDNLIRYIFDAGFPENNCRIWYADIPNLMTRKEHELVMSTEKI